jgi:hypothetical protein
MLDKLECMTLRAPHGAVCRRRVSAFPDRQLNFVPQIGTSLPADH